MDATMIQQTVDRILASMKNWLTEMVTQATASSSGQAFATLERTFRESAQTQMAAAFEQVLQAACDADDGGRTCPYCQARRRHKGRRRRKLLTSVGAVSIDGVCWQCPPPRAGGCGRHEHASQRLGIEESTTTAMRELICLLGLSQAGFAHAGRAMHKLLSVKLSTPTIASLCEEEGRRIEAADVPASGLVQGTLVGSCDGTMVNTREQSWRELRAWRFDDDRGRRGSGAALEDAAVFTPRLRHEALRHHADQVQRFVFVSDAATWIAQAVSEHLPEADEHVVDIYHAYQHIHDAARAIYGPESEQGRAWAQRWCDELYTRGGEAVRQRLRHTRFARDDQQAALDQLLGFLERHGERMDYPRYTREKIPISSGPMESTCKQLGRRLKGPGMRWRSDNLTPMACLISLWNDQQWDDYWQRIAA